MDYPEYRYIYSKIKCYKKTVYVDTTSTYKYEPLKNVYQCIKCTCSMYNSLKCNGRDGYNEPCFIINPLPIELSPDSKDFDVECFRID